MHKPIETHMCTEYRQRTHTQKKNRQIHLISAKQPILFVCMSDKERGVNESL